MKIAQFNTQAPKNMISSSDLISIRLIDSYAYSALNGEKVPLP